jgi:hypothetical protein
MCCRLAWQSVGVGCRGQRHRRRSGHGDPHAYGDQCENTGRFYDLSSVVNYWLARDGCDGIASIVFMISLLLPGA